MKVKGKERRKNGTGSFRTLKSGKVELRFTYRDENGNTCNKSVTGATESECIERAETFLNITFNAEPDADILVTIPEIVKRRLETDLKLNRVGEQGYSRNISTLKIIEKSKLGKIPVIQIEEKHIEAFLCKITKYSNSVIDKVYAQLKIGFNVAVEEGLINVNPLTNRNLRKPKSSKEDKVVRGFTEEEQAVFIRALEAHKVPYGRNNYKKQLLIELYSGMRMGEINALRPEDIDFERKIIYVRKTISRGKEFVSFLNDKTKTYNGMRDIPISKMLIPILEDAIASYRKNPEGLLFYDHNKGAVIETSQVNCFFRRICEKAKLPYYGQHALRHSFASRCIESGIDAVVLKKWLGHSNIHITLDTYADVFDRMNSNSIEKLEKYNDLLEKESVTDAGEHN